MLEPKTSNRRFRKILLLLKLVVVSGNTLPFFFFVFLFYPEAKLLDLQIVMMEKLPNLSLILVNFTISQKTVLFGIGIAR